MWWKILNHLEVKENKLYIANKNCISLAKKYGTPLYVLNADRVKENYFHLLEAIQKNLKREFKIFFSAKANSSMALLKILEKLGSCTDAVSPFEVLSAKLAGFDRKRILFTGTSVSNEDMILAAKYARINIDSFSQLERYANLVKKYKFNPKISIRINPEKGVGFISECITAGKDAKYGIPKSKALAAFKRALKLGLKPIGIHQHIGSGILGKNAFVFLKAAKEILILAGEIKRKLGIDFEFIDLGGGLGIPYRENQRKIEIEEFGKRLGKLIESKAKKYQLSNFALHSEPGRYIVGDAEILLVKVIDVSKKYINELGVDAGFNVLDRPARYKAYHEIVNANRVGGVKKLYRVSGNLCESGDVFTESKHHLRRLPITKEKEILAILNAGAYGYTMASNYNLRPRPREIMIEKGKIRIIRERENFKDLIKKQIY